MKKRQIKTLKVVAKYDCKNWDVSRKWLTHDTNEDFRKFTRILFGQYRETYGMISLNKAAVSLRNLGINYSQHDVENALSLLSKYSYFDNPHSLGTSVRLVSIENSVNMIPISESEESSFDKEIIKCGIVLAPLKRHFQLPEASWADPWEALSKIEERVDGFYFAKHGMVMRLEE